MSKLGTVIAFLAGAAIGGAAAWRIAGERYARMSEEDILSAKQAFRAREEKLKEELEALRSELDDAGEDTEKEDEPSTVLAAGRNQDKGDINDYARMVNRIKYAQPPAPRREDHPVEAPYVISPEEFGEMDGYTTVRLTYFEEDDILSDENGVVVDDPEEMVGDALNHFGEYEEDSVFVRSDPKRCDYEILKDLRSYAEFRGTLPPKI